MDFINLISTKEIAFGCVIALFSLYLWLRSRRGSLRLPPRPLSLPFLGPIGGSMRSKICFYFASPFEIFALFALCHKKRSTNTRPIHNRCFGEAAPVGPMGARAAKWRGLHPLLSAALSDRDAQLVWIDPRCVLWSRLGGGARREAAIEVWGDSQSGISRCVSVYHTILLVLYEYFTHTSTVLSIYVIPYLLY